jgi:hypothetical protein
VSRKYEFIDAEYADSSARFRSKGVARIGAVRGSGIAIAGNFAERNTLVLMDIDAERAPERAASLAGSEVAVTLGPDSGQTVGTPLEAVEADLPGAEGPGQASAKERTS